LTATDSAPIAQVAVAAEPITPAKNQNKLPRPALALLLPAIIVLLVLGVGPLLFALTVSFRDYRITTASADNAFIGLANYQAAFADSDFINALSLTFRFFIIALPIQIILGTLIALFIYGLTAPRISLMLRVLLVLPIAVTPTIMGLLGRLIFNAEFGVINYFLSLVGIAPIQWLADSTYAFIAVLILDSWQWTPFVALVMLAGLLMIPPSVLDAGKLEAGDGWNLFRYLQLPYLLPGLTAVLILRTIDIMKMYDAIYSMTKGGPGTATELMSVYVTRIGFKVFDIGLASAQAVLLLIIAIALSQLFIRVVYRQVEV
jgi:multiple sugar transport system permease protein